MSTCAGCEKVAQALAGLRDDVVAIFDHSVLLLGEHQAYPGYCVLWAREHAKELHDLPELAYTAYFHEARGVGAALEASLKPWKLNVASLGNVVGHAHLHFFPRQASEAHRLQHPWVLEAQFTPPSAAQKSAALKQLKEIFA